MTERVIEGEVVGRRAAQAAGLGSDWIRWQRTRSDDGRAVFSGSFAIAAYLSNAAPAVGRASTGIDFYV